MSKTSYFQQLYTLQDKALQLFNSAEIRHYLTGGTALSRAYYQHRYSEDLDFFLNNDKEFTVKTEKAIAILRDNFTTLTINNVQPAFQRVMVADGDVALKIEFINDVGFRYGQPVSTALYYCTDNPRNILSNKLTALVRTAAKDYADIIEISTHLAFNWKDVIDDAKQKDTWINEIHIIEQIKSFDLNKVVTDVQWVNVPTLKEIESAISNICRDIVLAADNSLVK